MADLRLIIQASALKSNGVSRAYSKAVQIGEACEIVDEMIDIETHYETLSLLVPMTLSQESSVKGLGLAYYRTAHDAMDARAEDDEFLKHVKFFGYDDRKEDGMNLGTSWNNPRITTQKSPRSSCFLG